MKQTIYQSNGIIARQERQKSYTRHINNLHKVYDKEQNIQETINSIQEKLDFQHKNRMNTQKYKLDQEKMKIQKENKKLLATLIDISENDKAYQQVQEAASLVLVQPSSKKYQQQQQSMKISDENFQLAYRMVNLPSVYPKKLQDVEYKIHQRRVSQLQKFQPENFFDPFSSQFSTKSSHRSSSPMSRSYMFMNFKSNKTNGQTHTSFYAPQSASANKSFSINRKHSNSPPNRQNESLNYGYQGSVKGNSPIFNQNDKYYGEPIKDISGANSIKLDNLSSHRSQQQNDQMRSYSTHQNQKNINNLDNLHINDQLQSIKYEDLNRNHLDEIPMSYFTPRKLIIKSEVNIIMKVSSFNLKIKPRTDDLNDHFYFKLKMSKNQQKDTPFFKYEQMHQAEFCFNFKMKNNKSSLSRRSSSNQNNTTDKNTSQNSLNQNNSAIQKDVLPQQDINNQNNTLNQQETLKQNISIDYNDNSNQKISVKKELSKKQSDINHNKIKCSLVQNKGNEIQIIGHFYINIDRKKKGRQEIETPIFQQGGDSNVIGQTKIILQIDYAKNQIRKRALKQHELSEIYKVPISMEQSPQLGKIQTSVSKQNIPKYALKSENTSVQSSIQGSLSGQTSLQNSMNGNIKDIIEQQKQLQNQFFTPVKQNIINDLQNKNFSISKDNLQIQCNNLNEFGYQPESIMNVQKSREYKSQSVEKRSQLKTENEIRSVSHQKRNIPHKLQNIKQMNEYSSNANLDDLHYKQNLDVINEYSNNRSEKKLQKTPSSHRKVKNTLLDNQINQINDDIQIIRQSLHQTAVSPNQKESLIKMHAYKNRLKQIKLELGNIEQRQITHSPKITKNNCSPSTKKLRNSHKKQAQSINSNKYEKETI